MRVHGLYELMWEKLTSWGQFVLPERQEFMDDSEATKEIRFEGRLYNVTNWIKYHPGGRVIEFYTQEDEDATEAIKQFHYRSLDKVLKRLKGFDSRPVPEKEEERKKETLSEDFEKLTQEFQAEGLFEPSPFYVGVRFLEVFLLGLISFYCASYVENIYLSLALSTFTLTIFMLRGAFLLHESGHYSIMGNVKADRLVTSLLAALCVGISGSWWRSHHNRHHAMPQRLHRDVNINSLPFLAYNMETVKGVKRSNEFPYSFILRHQAMLFVPTIAFGGFLGWKFYCCPKAALAKKQYHELVLMVVHYVLLSYLIGVLPLALATVLFVVILLLTFDTSHSHLSVTEEPRHWVEFGLTHTINVNSSWFWDWWTGYLNFQIEHHLFPTMPNFRLHKTSSRVKELAEKHKLPYITISYPRAIFLIFENLAKVSKEVVEHQERLVL